MEQGSLEAFNAWHRWKRRFAERSVAKDEDVSSDVTLRGGNMPALVVFVP
jgi:hypothetical protein